MRSQKIIAFTLSLLFFLVASLSVNAQMAFDQVDAILSKEVLSAQQERMNELLKNQAILY
jgi:hypothetical protein